MKRRMRLAALAVSAVMLICGCVDISQGADMTASPETAASRTSKKVSDDAISMAGRTLGGLVGDLASSALRTGATLAKSANGEKSVAVVSGYEFYLVKSERR